MPKGLTIEVLKAEAKAFANKESRHDEPSLYGVTDGKAIGTYLEHKFRARLAKKYSYAKGSSAKGIDFPELNVDVKVTSEKQPQSSCPFNAARQKIYGLGYDLLVFVYRKTDNSRKRTATLSVKHVIFVEKERTGDFQTTKGILQYVANGANEDDIVAFMGERMLPLEEIAARALAREILRNPPAQGYLTVSNALQWRLQYGHAISHAGQIDGIDRLA